MREFALISKFANSLHELKARLLRLRSMFFTLVISGEVCDKFLADRNITGRFPSEFFDDVFKHSCVIGVWAVFFGASINPSTKIILKNVNQTSTLRTTTYAFGVKISFHSTCIAKIIR